MSTVMTIGNRVDPKMVYDKKPMKRMTSFIVYALVKDPNDLASATYLDNREFYYVDLDKRYENILELMVIDISGEQFEMVTRRTLPDGINFVDTTSEISAASFLALKETSSLGFKHKYLQFPIPNSDAVWEVSVFLDNDGHDHPWVRCELFTDDISNISELPFPVQQFTVEGDPENPKEAVEYIHRLWTREYSRIDTQDVIKS